MTQEMYSIKEAAKALGVETHALRFWEDELELCIARNEQGRRIYSEENMQDFRRIMEWKRQGLQLKAIKQLMHGDQATLSDDDMATRRIILYRPKESGQNEEQRLAVAQRLGQYAEQAQQDLESMQKMDLERAEKARRLQELLKQFISESIRESNTELLQGMKEGLMKELDYQFRLQEEREEEREKLRIEKEDEHFRQLDENLRNAMEKRGRKKKKGIFSKKL